MNKYMLVIKNKKRNYAPIDWKSINKKNSSISSLKGIDDFTSQYEEEELFNLLIEHHLIEQRNENDEIAIIFKEKDRIREVKEGILFKNNKDLISDETYITNILKNINNKNFINNIYNLCNSLGKSEEIKNIKYILKKLDFFKQKGSNGCRAALLEFTKLPYEEKRKIYLQTYIRYLNGEENELRR